VSPRRELTLAVVACLAAAGLALLAASRTWTVETRARPAPLPAVVTGRTGGELVPALPALGLVALAGAGGLVATRGRGRSVLGALLVADGLAMAATTAGQLGRSGWPVAGVVAGIVVSAVGVATLARGKSWPALGSGYERPRRSATPRESEADAWDAIDRGIDPTRGALS